MNKTNIVLFSSFGALMAALHVVQCYFRVKAHQVFLLLLSSPKPTDEQSWIAFSNRGVSVEVLYYITGVLFFLFIGYRLASGKISLRSVVIGTFLIYLFTTTLILPLKISQKDVSNLFLPIFVSFLISFVIIVLVSLRGYLEKRKRLKNSNYL
ncbi:hypothetical protein [Caproiciproducens galactitolivorans]|uniref:Uncharacterized protein n=1 Tax=Caproiciproducens galactitolivorans TaxID=642589 RepID=A0ABT4BZD1_9FIRM|nr:hypothetical protein [Caproiciproducens galactitolivorans]MCY1715318.1 hypothetical protein [Caproiciproducens galactitolivorans]